MFQTILAQAPSELLSYSYLVSEEPLEVGVALHLISELVLLDLLEDLLHMRRRAHAHKHTKWRDQTTGSAWPTGVLYPLEYQTKICAYHSPFPSLRKRQSLNKEGVLLIHSHACRSHFS